MKAIQVPPPGKQPVAARLSRQTTAIAPEQVWSRLNATQRDVVKQALVEVCRRLTIPVKQEGSHEHR